MLDLDRQKDHFDPFAFEEPVHVVGCGGMGSRVAEGLARMGLGVFDLNPITLHDFDTFESHNLVNQWCTAASIGEYKVDAVRAQMVAINPSICVQTSKAAVVQQRTLSGLVIICVDTMKARRRIIDHAIEDNHKVTCVIETRMDAGVGVSHCFDPRDRLQLECWRLYWHSDEEADNMQGCGGPVSIISSIYGTTALALRQLEQYARRGDIRDVSHRVYQDFEQGIVRHESWPTQLDNEPIAA